MENMDKILIVLTKIGADTLVWPKIPQIPQNLSAQFVCPPQNFWISIFHWASVAQQKQTTQPSFFF